MQGLEDDNDISCTVWFGDGSTDQKIGNRAESGKV